MSESMEGIARNEPRCAECIARPFDVKNPHRAGGELHEAWDDGARVVFVAAATPDPPEDERRPWPIAPDTVMPPRRQPVRWGSRADDPPTDIHDDPQRTKAYLAGLAAGRTEAAAAVPTRAAVSVPGGTENPDAIIERLRERKVETPYGYAVVFAAVEEAVREAVVAERARIVKLLRDQVRQRTREGDTMERIRDLRLAADLIERGSGVPEGDDPTASA